MRCERLRPLGRIVARLAAVGACLVLGAVLTMPAASAGHGENEVSYYDRDNNNQSVERIGLAQSGNVACVWGKQRLDNTEINTHWAGDYDIRCRDGNYNKSWFGLTYCPKVFPNGRCDIYVLYFDWDFGRTIDSAWERKAYQYLGCHEFGHTSSVGHRAGDSNHNSCMKDGHGHVWLDNHDHAAINRDY